MGRAEPQKKITSMIERHTVIDQTDRNERLHDIIAVRSFHSIRCNAAVKMEKKEKKYNRRRRRTTTTTTTT
ncbi:hypothetical protein T4D_1713 [Trichinella pseudospiralis]|uniref:Uncharacterized protein n=1 Tax=Trichinella pseudospiralis TaxID=6337 RepID=A0A0V1F8U1_TRIPS|nr:hypothetical protein T4D_1713 [Trichinella pseudospiralis]